VKTRIGLFGGTFNPIHAGHIQAAREVRKAFGLDKVLFIPSYIPPHKESAGVAAASDRFRMVELACRGRPGFEASALEVEAMEKSYSILTLNKVRALYPEAWIFFILGVDAFLEIGTWHEYERVLAESLFIVTSRPGYGLAAAAGVLGGRLESRILRVRPRQAVDETLFARFTIFLLGIEALDVSSTEIRERLDRGMSLEGLVPRPVEAYITEHHLYKSPKD